MILLYIKSIYSKGSLICIKENFIKLTREYNTTFKFKFMIQHIKYFCLSAFVCLTISSCFYDVTEEIDVKKYNSKSIEEIVEVMDLTLFRSLDKVNDIPILAWLGIPQKYTSVDRFLQMKSAGINIKNII